MWQLCSLQLQLHGRHDIIHNKKQDGQHPHQQDSVLRLDALLVYQPIHSCNVVLLVLH